MVVDHKQLKLQEEKMRPYDSLRALSGQLPPFPVIRALETYHGQGSREELTVPVVGERSALVALECSIARWLPRAGGWMERGRKHMSCSVILEQYLLQTIPVVGERSALVALECSIARWLPRAGGWMERGRKHMSCSVILEQYLLQTSN
uniref:Uncharacterized protein n=1 Tax=Timema bartmani TaxID=61472 RepID=A0A7R9F2G4_9NEOP|nr:unnamed protein product [Timema bartmani]